MTQVTSFTQIPLRLELLDDVVFSRRGATAGGHESLDRIPGSALLGWAASRLWDTLGAPMAQRVFLSGAVRFLDGLPLSLAGERCAPVPLAWHEDKGDAHGAAGDGTRWRAERIFNLAAGGQERMPRAAQPRQLRSGYVGPDGACVRPQLRYRMMTAIGEAGRAAEGQLFGYQSLQRDQCFEARLLIDDTLPEPVRSQLLACFDRTLRVGRSRASQYGRVRSRPGAPLDIEPPAQPRPAHELRLWLLSDAWLRTPEGQPTLVPDGVVLGLPGAELVREATFLRSRAYSPWNAHRGCHEMERQVLCAGSVVTLRREKQPFTEDDLSRLSLGIGLGLAQGLGEVCVAPALLRTPQPVFEAAAPTKAQVDAATDGPLPRPQTRLLAFLARRSGTASRGQAAQRFVRHALVALVQELSRIRAFRSWDPQAPLGPGRSQWGQLALLGRQAASLEALQAMLLGAQGGACVRYEQNDPDKRNKDEVWGLGWQGGAQTHTLADWVRGQLEALKGHPGIDTEADRLYAWQLLCAEARQLDLDTSRAHLGRAHEQLQIKETA